MLLNALRCLLCAGIAILAAGCEECSRQLETPIPLRSDEMGKPCDEICGQLILGPRDGAEYTGCRSGITEEGALAAVCVFTVVTNCGSSHF